jgi:putative membrane protein
VFIDFLTLVMINLVAGTVLLAYYLYRGIDEKDQRPYAAAFFITGLVCLICGFQISFTWPLPGAYNVGYGDTTVLFGAVFLATAIALSQGWSLVPVSIYAFFAAIDAIIVGVRIFSLQLTKEPVISAVGFVLAGVAGLGVFPFLTQYRDNKVVRWLGVLLLAATAVLWGITFYGSLWGHMASFAQWAPATMQTPAP